MKRAGFHPCWAAAFTAVLVMGCGGEKKADPITVTMTTPVTDSYVGDEVTVTAEVGEGADTVSLVVDGVVVETLTAAPWTFTWDGSQATEGLHVLQLTAFGEGGRTGRSADCRVILDRTPPELTVAALELPAVFSGASNEIDVTATDEAGLLSIQVLADGDLIDSCDTSPCLVDWDVSALADGEAEITVEAEDLTGNITTQVVPVLVVNDGTVIALMEGDGGGSWVIPESWATMDIDMKYHFLMPAGVTSLMAVLQWSRSEWPFELAIGTGTCPHSGVEYDALDTDGGQVVVHHAATDLSLTTYTADEQWFLHLAAGYGLDMAANVNEGSRVGFIAVVY